MGRSRRLRVGEVRAACRLVGECRELGDDPARWRPHLFAGVAGLTGAVFVVAGEMRPPGAGGAAFEAVDGAGQMPADDLSQWRAWIRRAGPGEHPVGDSLARLPAARVTRRRRSVVADPEWYRSAFYDRWLAPYRADDGVFSGFRTAAGGVHLINAVRAAGDRPFGRREAALVHLLQAELGPHLGRSLAAAGDPAGRLPPRLRQVLDTLLDGDSEKQAAGRLGVRPATVREYVTALYRRFGVESRAELLAHFLRRHRRPPGPG